ncbi:MAG: hypothetical protein ACE5JI_22670, partial [Acidobacteriota bacterium]
TETRKVLHAYLAIGFLRAKAQRHDQLDRKLAEGEDYGALVELYNEMFRHLFRHMSDEVGPIAEVILEKYLNELKGRPGSLFARARLRRDGSLDVEQIERNVLGLEENERKGQLIEALNELLYAELLAVKRTLGASHESQLVHVFRKMRGEA